MTITKVEEVGNIMNGKRVLVRVGFDVPVDDNGYVKDDFRIIKSIPTIRYILENGGLPILMAHQGRPLGRVVESLKMKHVGEKLQELLGEDYKVVTLGTWKKEGVEKAVKKMQPKQIVLLENLRFKKEEEKKVEKDIEKRKDFAKWLCSLADIGVYDSTATLHRDDTSCYLTPLYLPFSLGKLVQEELRILDEFVQNPGNRPILILGGSKVTDKIGVVERLYDRMDRIFIGGKMSLAFLKAKGYETGASEVDDEDVAAAQEALERDKEIKRIMLPIDMVVADDDKDKSAEHKTVSVANPPGNIPLSWFALDIGEDTYLAWSRLIGKASSFFWNGPMGKFELPYAAKGTKKIADPLIAHDKRGIVCGGDTYDSLKGKGFSSNVSFLTGGGASIAYLSGEKMPVLEALEKCPKR